MRTQRGFASGLLTGWFALALAGCGGGGGSSPAAQNRAPTADAGADQTVMRNAAVTLDGTASADPDENSLSYRWVQTGGTPVTLSLGTTSRPTFTAPNTPGTLNFELTTNDGKIDSAVDHVTITVFDSPPVISAATAPPTALLYGDTATFTLTASDPDGDPIPDYEVAFGPAGFSITPDGNVSWTASGPLFDRVTNFNWGVRLTGVPSALLTGIIEVTDATREYPLRRTNLSIPVQHSGLRVADLDGDGAAEMLIGAAESLYVLSRRGGTYQQSWVYPFDIGMPDINGNDLQAVTAADIDGDGRQEIFFSQGGRLVRLDGTSRREAARAELRCRGLEVTDLDGDGPRELVCLGTVSGYQYETDGRLTVLNPSTLTEIWSTPQVAVGSSMAIGNVDADAALEIVTSGGVVYDGVMRQSQWNYGYPFGRAVATGDLDGNGIEEIFGLGYWAGIRAFSAVSSSVLWDFTPSPSSDLYSVAVDDANGDGRLEVIIGSGPGGNLTGVGYNTTLHQPEMLWEIDPQQSGVSSIAVGDVDGDGSNEIVWGAGIASSLRDQLVIAGFTPVISVKWQSDGMPQFVGEFSGGELARIGAGATRLMFAVSRSDSFSGGRAIAMTPTTGEVLSSGVLGLGCCSEPAAVAVADYNNDGVDELFIGSDDRYGVYDIAGAVVTWQSQPPNPSQHPFAIKQADMNGDGYADLVGLNDRGGVEIHDVQAQSLLWSGGTSGTSAALVLNDLDNDGEQEILVALRDRIIVYGRNSTGTAYLERASVSHPNTADVVVADQDGNAEPEIYALTYPISDGNHSTLNVFDTDLQPIRSVQLGVDALALFVEQSAFARKNLLLSIAGDIYPRHMSSALWAIDPVDGTDVWRSPPLIGRVTRGSLHFADIDGDGDDEIAFGTAVDMIHTQ